MKMSVRLLRLLLGRLATSAQWSLIELIRDKDRYDFDGGASQRSQYMFALGLIGDERVEPLITVLEDEDGDVCSSAAEARGRLVMLPGERRPCDGLDGRIYAKRNPGINSLSNELWVQNGRVF